VKSEILPEVIVGISEALRAALVTVILPSASLTAVTN